MKKILVLSPVLAAFFLLRVFHFTSPAGGGETDASWADNPASAAFSSLELADVRTHLSAVPSSDLPQQKDMPMSYLCLWTSGTYSETGVWNWTDTDFTFTVGSDGSLEIEFINALCSNPSDYYASAAAVYYPANENKMGQYDLFGSTYLGYLPALPTGWCWIFTVDYEWTGLPHSHGISVTVDWASAINRGETVPPVAQTCGWPLVWAPPPFAIDGI